MNDEISRTKELFLALIDLEPRDRTARLDELCGGDDGLRGEVEGLLHAHFDSGPFLEKPAFLAEGRADPAALLQPGERVGAYSLLEVLGEGGMGVVYLAEQSEPLRRRVALKVLKPGMDSRRVMARFEGERQVLALMAHPGIARVHDAGTTEQGYPYFVMEYVEGESLVDYCEARKLDVRRRIELFLAICDAIQHAHQKGILHRDLKPTNLLVTEQSGRPAPKVIDFGVAKALVESTGLEAGLTLDGTVIGTPEYMSPEQADRAESAVDTRSDIYSLGVVLYELLTGTLPVDVRGALSGGFTAIRERLLREEAPRASTRAKGAFAEALRGDLDWILARALEKDPDDRYASVSELAADLQRHLANLPVLAGPPTGIYRVRKFIARNRGKVLAAGLALAALLVGLTLSVWGWIRSQRAEEDLLRLSDRVVVDRLLAEAEALPFGSPADAPALARMEAELERLLLDLPAFEESLLSLREHSSNATGSAAPAGGEPAFATAEERWKHGLLTELTGRLSDLASSDPGRSALERVRRRRALALESAAASVEGHRPEWVEAIAAIADEERSPAYEGLELTPQHGLVPLGQDARSGLGEFWHPLGGERPERGEDGAWRIAEETGLVLVLIPAGSFEMGSRPARSTDGDDAVNVSPISIPGEGPVHHVELGEPFFLSKYEMTQGQWLRLTWHNPSSFGPHFQDPFLGCDLRHPVETVSQGQALSLLRRIGFTLPTEAQWEYAARAGSGGMYSCGNDKFCLEGAANVRGIEMLGTTMVNLSGLIVEPWDDGWANHAPVGTYAPNDFGLLDVHGNVFEWVLEGLGSYKAPTDSADGRRLDPELLPCSLARGGSFSWTAWAARVTNRADAPAGVATGENGFRPSRPVVR